MGRYERVSNKDNRGADLLRSGSTQQAEEGNGEARFIEARLDKASEKGDGGADIRRTAVGRKGVEKGLSLNQKKHQNMVLL